jgi:hypothetical protein
LFLLSNPSFSLYLNTVVFSIQHYLVLLNVFKVVIPLLLVVKATLVLVVILFVLTDVILIFVLMASSRLFPLSSLMKELRLELEL